MTGWAQVNGWRGNTSLEKRIEFDLYYIENWSLSLDFKIMWLTLTRGPKVTSGMSPLNNRAGCTLIVLAEWKPPVFGQTSLRLVSSAIRRNSPSTA